MITTSKTIKYTVTYNNGVIASVRDNKTGQFVKVALYNSVVKTSLTSHHLALVEMELATNKACLSLHTDIMIINAIKSDIQLCLHILQNPDAYYVKDVFQSDNYRIVSKSSDDTLYCQKCR